MFRHLWTLLVIKKVLEIKRVVVLLPYKALLALLALKALLALQVLKALLVLLKQIAPLMLEPTKE
jgi:hypothetical protein